MQNCLTMCIFPGWSLREVTDMTQAATGWDVSEFELLKLGERALTLARVFNVRQGLTADDDKLCERSYGPTQGGALAEGGIDRDELEQAMRTYYGMMGWDRETGVPTVEQAARVGRRLGGRVPARVECYHVPLRNNDESSSWNGARAYSDRCQPAGLVGPVHRIEQSCCARAGIDPRLRKEQRDV